MQMHDYAWKVRGKENPRVVMSVLKESEKKEGTENKEE